MPSGVPALTAARSMSPVEIWGIPNFSQINLACVPFPAPGAPNKINRMVNSLFIIESGNTKFKKV
jgi:hypothetical protein